MISMVVAAALLAVMGVDSLAAEAAPAVERVSVSWFRRTFARLSWEETKSVVRTPREASAAVRHAVKYREDFGDEWTQGRETWERGFGDCEDMAFAVVELCRAVGQDARVVVFSADGSIDAHAVATGVIDGKVWLSSNGWYSTARSMEEAKDVVAREMRWKSARVDVRDLLEGELAMAVASRIGPRP